MSASHAPVGEIERTADVMFQNYDEARNWVEDADLTARPLVLEDHHNDEHISTCRISGASGRYRLKIINHEGRSTTTEQTVDAVEVAEMMGGWTVAGRLKKDTDDA